MVEHKQPYLWKVQYDVYIEPFNDGQPVTGTGGQWIDLPEKNIVSGPYMEDMMFDATSAARLFDPFEWRGEDEYSDTPIMAIRSKIRVISAVRAERIDYIPPALASYPEE